MYILILSGRGEGLVFISYVSPRLHLIRMNSSSDKRRLAAALTTQATTFKDDMLSVLALSGCESDRPRLHQACPRRACCRATLRGALGDGC